MANEPLRVATVFSGIGAFEHALMRMEIPHEIVFACDTGEINIFQKKFPKGAACIPVELKVIREMVDAIRQDGAEEEYLKDLEHAYQQVQELYRNYLDDPESDADSWHRRRTKDIKERMGMIYEKIRVHDIKKHLKTLPMEERKPYIDSLYENGKRVNYVRESYLANYDLDPKDFYWDINFLDGKPYRGQIDIFVGGSPCQSFSMAGKRRGLEDTRGTLFYQYARLIKEIQPKVFIYENVRALLNHDHGKTWEIMQSVFKELGYDWHAKVLNAKDYGIPQSRNRLYVVGIRRDLALAEPFQFPEPVPLPCKMQDFLMDNVSGRYYLPPKGARFVTNKRNVEKRFTQVGGDIALCQVKNQQSNWIGDFVFVEENHDMEKTMEDLEKYFLSPRCLRTVMGTGTKTYHVEPEIDMDVAHTLLATMHKMHRAGIDNYVTTRGRIRRLTPRECLRLMGFCDSFKIVVSDTEMYHQTGNSIVVDVLIAILNRVFLSLPSLVVQEGKEASA